MARATPSLARPPPAASSAASRGSFARGGEGAGQRPGRLRGASAGGGGGGVRDRIAPPRPAAAAPSRISRGWVAACVCVGVRTVWGYVAQCSDPRDTPNFPNLPQGCRGEHVLHPQFHDGGAVDTARFPGGQSEP